ncbi:uncharacterized protein [Procambarus clarkii]|uniref:uncharacterized protein n=1 Tax=Procambarus clarkii TaxID=6728 RepID=UPI003741EFE6
MSEGTYSPVTQGEPAGDAVKETEPQRWRKTLRSLGWKVFPFVSALLYLSDVLSTFCYVGVLFSLASERDVILRGLNFRWWGSLIIIVHVVSGIFINFIATFYRHEIKILSVKKKVLEGLKCIFIPEFYVCLAMYRHVEMAVSGGPTSVNVVERAAFTRVLQAVLETVPQTIIQAYFFFTDFTPRATSFLTWTPVASMCLSMISAAFGYTFFVVYKYYDQEYEYPHFWQCSLVALASLLILGSRALTLSVMASFYWPWLALLSLLITFLISFVWWTYKVWKQNKPAHKNIVMRIAFSIIETFAVSENIKRMLVISTVFAGLTVASAIQHHNTPEEWSLVWLPFTAQVLGCLLVLPCRHVYKKAYRVLVLSVMRATTE